GFFFGLMAVMVIYNSVVFFIIRDRSYFYCVLYLFSILSFFLVFSGIANQYISPDIRYWNERLPLTLAILSMAFSIKFSSEFVALKRLSGKYYRVSNILLIALIALAFFSIKFPMQLMLVIISFIPFYGLYVLAMLFFAVREGSREARITLLAFLVFLLPILVFVITA